MRAPSSRPGVPFQRTYNLCAKALLFGEYAALYGFPAAVVTFPQQQLAVRVTLESQASLAQGTPAIQIFSDWFPQGHINFTNLQQQPCAQERFFWALLKPWEPYLGNLSLRIDVLSAFPPHLGFGSSSALVAGVSLGLWEFLEPQRAGSLVLAQAPFWALVEASLQGIQGQASGYDVAAQLAALVFGKQGVCCWRFQKRSPIPLIEPWPIDPRVLEQYGCFVSTHVYSNTAQALSCHANSIKKEEFVRQQDMLCQQFFSDGSVDNVLQLMQHSQALCRDYGLFPPALDPLVAQLGGLAFKSMGAGMGDCLWVLAPAKTLVRQHAIPPQDIAFSFLHISNQEVSLL